MEEARKGSTHAVLKANWAALENEMLKEHLWPQAHIQLKEAWSAYISKHFAQTSAGPSATQCKPLQGCDSSGIALWGWWWRYSLRTLNGDTQTSVLCNANASQ